MNKFRFKFEMQVANYDVARQIVRYLSSDKNNKWPAVFQLVHYSEDEIRVRTETNFPTFNWNDLIDEIDFLEEKFLN